MKGFTSTLSYCFLLVGTIRFDTDRAAFCFHIPQYSRPETYAILTKHTYFALIIKYNKKTNMSEQLQDRYAVKEIKIPIGEGINVSETVEAVREHGIIVYDVRDKSEGLNQILDRYTQNVSPDFGFEEFPRQVGVGQKYTKLIWEQISDNESRFTPVNGLLNVYFPGDRFPKHVDLDEKPTGEGTPEESLSFLYIASGSKDIYFYLEGEDGPMTKITQHPGELYVFQGGGYIFPDGYEVRGLYHEVPSQGLTDSVTFNWELMPVSS